MRRSMASVTLVASATLIVALAGCSADSNGGDVTEEEEAVDVETVEVAAEFGDCVITGEAGTITLDTLEDGVLTLGTNLPSPAWWQGTSPETIDGGFEYCLGAEIAHSAGIDTVVVKNVSWDGLIAGQDNDFDIAMAQVSITPEREEAVDFSTPYYNSMVGVLVATDSGVTADNIKEKQLGYQVGTTSEIAVDMIDPTTPARVFQDQESMVAAVASGQIDAALQDSAIMVGFAQNSDGAMEVIGQFDTDEVYGAIYPAGSPNVEAFNDVITQLEDSGAISALTDMWLAPAFGGNPEDIPMFN